MNIETALHEKSLSVTSILIKKLVQTLHLTKNCNLLDATELVLESFDQIELFVLQFIKNKNNNQHTSLQKTNSKASQQIGNSSIEVQPHKVPVQHQINFQNETNLT